MPENNDWSQFNDLISQVSSNEIETEDKSVKSETLQLLWDARGIIELASRQWKDKEAEIRQKYEKVRLWIIEATKNDLKITRAELDWLKAEVNKTNEKLADFYVNNVDMLKLELNKDVVIKTLNKLVADKKWNIKNLEDISQLTVKIKDINKNFKWDLDVLKATRDETIWFTSEDIQQIPEDFFSNEKNLEYMLKHSNEKWLIVLIASKNIGEDKLINIIWSINNETINESSKILDKHIPIEILNKDIENKLKMNLDSKNMSLDKINKLAPDFIDKLINEWTTDNLSDEIEYFLSKYNINDLSDEVIEKILSITMSDDTLKYAPKFIFGLNEKTNIVKDFILNNDENLIKYLPNKISKNNEVQKSIIDKIALNVRNNSNNDLLLNYIDVDDAEIARYFYKTIKDLWNIESSKIFSNFTIRESIRRIVKNENFNKEESDKEMLSDLASYDWWKELIDAASKNRENLEKLDIDKKMILSSDLIEKLWLNVDKNSVKWIIDEIIKLDISKLWEKSADITYNKLLKICWNDINKVKAFISEIKWFQIKENVVESNNIKEELKKKKFDKFNVNLDNLENDFDVFLVKKVNDYKEKNKDKQVDIKAISKQALEEYIKNNKKEWISIDEEEKLKKILNNFLENRDNTTIINEVDSFSKVLSWEIKKEDFEKIVQKSFEKAYDFEAEKEIVKQQEKIENDYRIKNGLWWINNEISNSLQYDYKKVEWGYSLVWQNWETVKWLVISEQEKLLAEKNPDAAKNLVNFYETLDKLWLNSIWKYREDISSSIWGINWASLNYNDDSLGQNELKIFLNAILVSVWETKIDMWRGVDEFINLFRNKNDFQVIWEWYKNNTNKIWWSKIEEKFMEKYVLWFPKFQNTAFADSLSKPIVKT